MPDPSGSPHHGIALRDTGIDSAWRHAARTRNDTWPRLEDHATTAEGGSLLSTDPHLTQCATHGDKGSKRDSDHARDPLAKTSTTSRCLATLWLRGIRPGPDRTGWLDARNGATSKLAALRATQVIKITRVYRSPTAFRCRTLAKEYRLTAAKGRRRPRKAVEGRGRPRKARKAAEGRGRPRKAAKGRGRPRKAAEGRERPREAARGRESTNVRERPREAARGRERPREAVRGRERPRVRDSSAIERLVAVCANHWPRAAGWAWGVGCRAPPGTYSTTNCVSAVITPTSSYHVKPYGTTDHMHRIAIRVLDDSGPGH
eukprot:3884685-Prymnesium_polylepis.3